MIRKVRPNLQDQLSDWVPDSDSVESLKFDLYVKSKEISQIVGSLKYVMLLPATERKKWISTNESMMMELMDSFIDDSVLAMDGLQLDQESMNLSVELVTNMRDAMNMINNIFSGRKKLKS